MNRETQRMLAHQMLLDATVFRDAQFGASKCPICNSAALQRAGEVAHLVHYDGPAFKENGRLVGLESASWSTEVDIVAKFGESVRIAHTRHSA